MLGLNFNTFTVRGGVFNSGERNKSADPGRRVEEGAGGRRRMKEQFQKSLHTNIQVHTVRQKCSSILAKPHLVGN